MLGKLIKPPFVIKMQCAVIVFFLVMVSGSLLSLQYLGKPFSGPIYQFESSSLLIAFAVYGAYDVWQSIYVTHLMIKNVAKLDAHKKSLQTKMTSSVGDESKKASGRIKEGRLQIQVTKCIIFSNLLTFLSFLGGFLALIILVTNRSKPLIVSICEDVIMIFCSDA